MKVLVIATHPDDEILGCGGTLARHVASGDEVHAIVVTRGAEDIYAPETVARGRAELARAHTVIGIKECHYLDFPLPNSTMFRIIKLPTALKRSLLISIRPLFTCRTGVIYT